MQTGVGSPTVELILNSKDPLERQYVDQAIKSRLAEVETAVSKQVLRVAVSDLQQVLNGGSLNFLGQNFPLLGLRKSHDDRGGAIAVAADELAARAGAEAGRRRSPTWPSRASPSPARCSARSAPR